MSIFRPIPRSIVQPLVQVACAGVHTSGQLIASITSQIVIVQPSAYAGTYTVSDADVAAGPFTLVAPRVSGNTAIGETVTLQPGLYAHSASAGTPDIEVQWIRNGAAIPGQTSGTHTISAEDLAEGLGVRETATNTAGSVAETLTVLLPASPAPQVIASLPDMCFQYGSGIQIVDASAAFAGTDISYAISPADDAASIDGGTGIVTHSTGAVSPQVHYTVTATNPDGSASTAYSAEVAPTAPAISIPDLTRVTGGDMSVDLSAYVTDDGGDGAIVWGVAPLAGVSLAGSVLSFADSVGSYAGVAVTATNGGGSATDTFDFTVAAASGYTIADNIAGVDVAFDDADSPAQVLITGTDTAYTAHSPYTLSAQDLADIDAGLPVEIVPATAAEGPADSFTATPGLWISPADDAAVVIGEWYLNGNPTGATGAAYANPDNANIDWRENAQNIATDAGGVDGTPAVARTLVSTMAGDTAALYWFEAGGVATDGAGNITAWTDATGNGNDIAAVPGLAAPVWNAGESRAEFYGAHGLKGAAGSDTVRRAIADGGQARVLAVLRQPGIDAAYGIGASQAHSGALLAESNSHSGDPYIRLNATVNSFYGANARSGFGVTIRGPVNGGAVTVASANGTVTAALTGVVHLVEFTFSQSDLSVAVDTATHVAATAFDVANWPGIDLAVAMGGRINGGTGAIDTPLRGDIHEVFATASTDTATLAAIRSELAAKHGITLP
ncbi:hypothetical protein [Tropicimonas sp.]|uniref:hypothetical protein n=1 Tax=Tropicimonas sp. TaxID=2067044 RepID=UPI003A861312